MEMLLLYGLVVGAIFIAAGWMLFEARSGDSATVSLLRDHARMPAPRTRGDYSHMRMLGVELMGIGVGHIAMTVTLLPQGTPFSIGIIYLGAYLAVALFILFVLWLVSVKPSSQGLSRTSTRDRRGLRR